jgi:hypothetical protein
LQFVRDNAHKAVLKQAEQVNGVTAQVLEWEVADAEKFKAFHMVGESTRHGGRLRVYVSPALGFALPRIEYLGKNGMVASSFDSDNFVEPVAGIFIPKRCSKQDFPSQGPKYFAVYDITEVKSVNQPIPDSEFVVQLPVGTHAADNSSGKSSTVFDIKADGPLPQGLEAVVVRAPPPFWGRNWHTAAILGFGTGAVLIGGWLAFRRRTFRSQPS